MIRKIIISFIFCFILTNSVFASINKADDKIKVVASFSILADVVANIGGDRIVVTSLIGPNQDAHGYSLKPSDLRKINSSQLLFINGLGLEGGWVNSLTKQDGYKGKIVIVSNGVSVMNMLDDSRDGHDHDQDPHIWGDPNLVAKYYVVNIESALISIDPKNKTYYMANSKIYLNKLVALNSWVLSRLNTIPENKRIAVTTHDAFAYMAHAYKIRFIFAQGISTDSDASAKDIVKLLAIIKTNKIKVVFLENMTNNKLIKQVAKDSGAIIGGELYSDALSNNSGEANNYINLVKYNVNTLVIAWES